MWIERNTLALEIPAAGGLDTRQLCEMLASLGFPVDEVATREGGEVLDVDITANRGDAMSHRGIARAKAGDTISISLPNAFVHLFDADGLAVGVLPDWQTAYIR